MELKDIQYIMTIAEEQSFSKAAQKLYISQPALSMCVQRLEKELNTKLFIRENRRLIPTPTGLLLLEDGRRILEMTHKMTQKINDVVNLDKGNIRIGFSQFYGRYYSPKLFSTFRKQYPWVHIEIIEDFSDHLYELISCGELDLALMPTPILTEGIIFVPLFQERIYFAMSKNVDILVPPSITDNLPTIDLSVAKDQPFILLKKHRNIRKISDQMCFDAGFSPKVLFESQDMNTINNYISQNMGVGFVSEIIEQTSDKRDYVNYFFIKSDKAIRNFGIAYRKANSSPACRNFIIMAKEFF